MAENIHDELEKLAYFKEHQDFTSEHVLKGLSESFVVLNNLLEESKISENNIEQMFQMLDNLKNIVENMNTFYQNQGSLETVVENIKVLSKHIEQNNEHIINLFKIIDKQHNSLQELLTQKDDKKFVEIKTETPKRKKEEGFLYNPYFMIFMIVIVGGFLLYKVIV